MADEDIIERPESQEQLELPRVCSKFMRQSVASSPWAGPVLDVLWDKTDLDQPSNRVELAGTKEHGPQIVTLVDFSGLSILTDFCTHRELSGVMEKMSAHLVKVAGYFGVPLIDMPMGDDGKFGLPIHDQFSSEDSWRLMLFLSYLAEHRVPTGLSEERHAQLLTAYPNEAHKFAGNTIGVKVAADVANAGEVKTSVVVDRAVEGTGTFLTSGPAIDRIEKLEKKAKVGHIVLGKGLLDLTKTHSMFPDGVEPGTDACARILAKLKAHFAARTEEGDFAWEPYVAAMFRVHRRAQTVIRNLEAEESPGTDLVMHRGGTKQFPDGFPYQALGKVMGVPFEVDGPEAHLSDEVKSRINDKEMTLIGRSSVSIELPESYTHEQTTQYLVALMTAMKRIGLVTSQKPKVDNRRVLLEFQLPKPVVKQKCMMLFNLLGAAHPEHSYHLAGANAVSPVRIAGDFSLERDRGGAAMTTSPIMGKLLSQPGVFAMHGPFAAQSLDRPVEWEHLAFPKKGIRVPVVVAKPTPGRLREEDFGGRELIGVAGEWTELQMALMDQKNRFISMGHRVDPSREALANNARFGKSALGRDWVRQHPNEAVNIMSVPSNTRYPVAQRVMECLCEAIHQPPYGDVEEALSRNARFNVAGPLTIFIDVPVSEEDLDMLYELSLRTPHGVKFLGVDWGQRTDARIEFGEKNYNDFLDILTQNAVQLSEADRGRLLVALRTTMTQAAWEHLCGAHAITPPLADRVYASIKVSYKNPESQKQEVSLLSGMQKLPEGHDWSLSFEVASLDASQGEHMSRVGETLPPHSSTRNLLYVAAHFNAPISPGHLLGMARLAFPQVTFVDEDVEKLLDEGFLDLDASHQLYLKNEAGRADLRTDLMRVEGSFSGNIQKYIADTLLDEVGVDVYDDASARQAEAALEYLLVSVEDLDADHIQLLRNLFDYYHGQGETRSLFYLARSAVYSIGFRPDLVNVLPAQFRLDLAEVLYLYEDKERLADTSPMGLGTLLAHFLNTSADQPAMVARASFLRDGMATALGAAGDDRIGRIAKLQATAAGLSEYPEYALVLRAAALYQSAFADAGLSEADFEESLNAVLADVVVEPPMVIREQVHEAEHKRMTLRRLASAILQSKAPKALELRELAMHILHELDTYYQPDKKVVSSEGVNVLHDLVRHTSGPTIQFLQRTSQGNAVYFAFAKGEDYQFPTEQIEPLGLSSLKLALENAGRFLDVSLKLPKIRYRADALREFGNAYEVVAILARGGYAPAVELFRDNWARFETVHQELLLEGGSGFNDYEKISNAYLSMFGATEQATGPMGRVVAFPGGREPLPASAK